MNRFERIAHNQSDFRDRNERSIRGEIADGEHAKYVCECDKKSCTQAVNIPDAEYERVREDPNRFVLCGGGHVAAGAEVVVEDHGRYVVAEKIKGREVAEQRDTRTHLKTCRVLVVDDVVEVRILLKILIQMEPDCTVIAEAGNGIEAVAAAKEASPDVVILDLEMPEMSGYDALPLIVKACPQVRVIAFTAAEDVDQRQLAEDGAFDMVPKDGDPGVIMAAVRRAASQLVAQ